MTNHLLYTEARNGWRENNEVATSLLQLISVSDDLQPGFITYLKYFGICCNIIVLKSPKEIGLRIQLYSIGFFLPET